MINELLDKCHLPIYLLNREVLCQFAFSSDALDALRGGEGTFPS